MEEYSIGFRMKFDNVEPEDIVKVVTEFLNRFDRYEIKVTNNIISSGKIYVLLEISERLASGKYSLHLPKNVLSNAQAYTETKNLIKMLQHYRSTKIVHLIMHIPFGSIHKYLKYIFSISMDLPENYVLLLENEKTDSNNYKYLRQIDELCALLCKQEITNVGICLDIGHLLFGAYKEGIIQGHCLEQLTKMSCTLSMIKQIHIHDYLGRDHLQLGEGIMSLENVSRFIVENGLMVPIIIEATVKQPEYDGVKQISIMAQVLRNIEEMME